jgi:hypothetical protein
MDFSLACAVRCGRRVGWFLLALVISPLIAGLLLLALPGKGRRLGRKRF